MKSKEVLKKTQQSKQSKLLKIIIIVGIILFLLSVALILYPLLFQKIKGNVLYEKEDGPIVGIANPASTYCVEHNNTFEIRNDDQGNQYGVCINTKTREECEEWAFFRGECEL